MKIYPEIILACNRKDKTLIGGVKFYFLAKHYDREGGSGLIHEKQFRNYLDRYFRISRATYYRWKKQAADLDLFTDHGGILQLVSWGHAAISTGCERVTLPVEVSANRFVDSNGLSEVWAGYIKQFEPKPASDKHPAQKQRPITKTTLSIISGIPGSTQRYYEAKAGVIKTANIAHIVSTYQGAENAPTQEGGGNYTKNGCHRKRLGNTYRAPNRIKRLKAGRTNKINGLIRAALLNMSSSDQPEKPQKFYYQPVYKPMPRKTIEHERNRREKAIKEAREKGEQVPNFAPYKLYRKVSPVEQIIQYLKKRNQEKRPEYVYSYDRTSLGVGLWVAHLVTSEAGV